MSQVLWQKTEKFIRAGATYWLVWELISIPCVEDEKQIYFHQKWYKSKEEDEKLKKKRNLLKALEKNKLKH